MLDIQSYKSKLEAEKTKLEEELDHLATEGEVKHGIGEKEDEREPDPVDMANRFEDYEEKVSTKDTLEGRLNSVKTALLKINDGTYGKCQIADGDHPIEEARLEANPAATTCVEHISRKSESL